MEQIAAEDAPQIRNVPTAVPLKPPPAKKPSSGPHKPHASCFPHTTATAAATKQVTTPAAAPVRTTKRAAALNAIPAIVTADVLDLDDSPMHCALLDSPSPQGWKPIGRKRRIADLEDGVAKCGVVPPKGKKPAVQEPKSTILGEKVSRKKAAKGKRKGAAAGHAVGVQNVLPGGNEGSVGHEEVQACMVEVLLERSGFPEQSAQGGECWPHESFLWTWSECENVQFNA